MLQLPGSLKSTTLGDVFGTLHRARVTGTLELVEACGQTHSLRWREGLLIDCGAGALSARVSLDSLFRLRHASLRFRVMGARPRGHALAASHFLWGRRRARDHGGSAARHPLACDLAMLGLHAGASLSTVRARFRELARHHHPDVHSLAGRRAELHATRRFQALACAYERIVAHCLSSQPT